MGLFEIAVSTCQDDPAVLRVLRSFSSESLASLRSRLRSAEPALTFSTDDYLPDMELEETVRQQRARFLDACSRLEKAGATVALFYRATADDPREDVDMTGAQNLFQLELDVLAQEHD